MRKYACMVVMIIAFFLHAEAKSKVFFWNTLIDAISWTESRGKESAVSSCGRYVGHLQISKILVRQCNRIVGYKKYSYEDRYKRDKSNQMFIDFQEHYNPERSIEKAIRLWNSGDLNCMNKKRVTDSYYNRVMVNYRKLALVAIAD